ncbi:FAD-dependent thymidylate synthase [candidate division KSB1 bacterium]|nr:MAG: FAD-dependent thymidylate synthase [candidate division KSB1 bacterium]
MPLTVRLAGYNIDADLLQETLDFLQSIEPRLSASSDADDIKSLLGSIAEKLHSSLSPEAFTPETLSAAYARISRDPKYVTDLRRAARGSISRARKSNDNIIFGLGHASVAEHACFNFDISGLSRLACEELQSHRLLSFTEKSQRYITLSSDYIVPPELAGSAWERRFHELIQMLFTEYEAVCRQLQLYHTKRWPTELTPDQQREIETCSKEDARYVLPLACSTQMGMTANARNVEHLACEFSDHPLQELRDLGKALRQSVSVLAPSLVKYTERGNYPRKNRTIMAESIGKPTRSGMSEPALNPMVQLLDATPNGEERVLSALAFSFGCEFRALSRLTAEQTERVWREMYRNMSEHDGPAREFELAEITFEAFISASCFAQLKRHRMLTLLPQPYFAENGFIIPPSIEEAGMRPRFTDTVNRSTENAALLTKDFPLLAPYLLTNAHRRRVLIQINARELYHFTRLRSDSHAQWEIRSLSDQMLIKAREIWPNLMALACGKDRFSETMQRWMRN